MIVKALRLMNFPVAVALNLFAADLRVFNFDIWNILLLVY